MKTRPSQRPLLILRFKGGKDLFTLTPALSYEWEREL